MSDLKSPPVPSMDEILATVRRIIAEDEELPAARSSGGSAVSDEAGDGDDVLELTEAINQDGSTRHLAPIGSAARPEGGLHEPSRAASPADAEAEPQRREAPGAKNEPAMGDRTLEVVVCDLLRPLLRTWLEDNLPEIVERLARAEIARVVDESGRLGGGAGPVRT
jgi:uncharacterized protein